MDRDVDPEALREDDNVDENDDAFGDAGDIDELLVPEATDDDD